MEKIRTSSSVFSVKMVKLCCVPANSTPSTVFITVTKLNHVQIQEDQIIAAIFGGNMEIFKAAVEVHLFTLLDLMSPSGSLHLPLKDFYSSGKLIWLKY